MSRPLTAALALAFLAAVSGAAAADAPPAAPKPVIVKADAGPIAGSSDGKVATFLGIAYAAPPVGPLRWRPPQPTAHWSTPRDATRDGPACPQAVTPGRFNAGGYDGPTSEDCLTLDVWAPAKARKAPVMVWIYGGGNVAGADSIAPNDGRFFARDGVVLVSFNYRLGALGFFAHPALTAEAGSSAPVANYGLMDQIAALKWVQRNIAAFGGDPANVTIFGESAGGGDVLDLMASPAARGLFEKATVQSGGGWGEARSLADAEAAGVALATKLGLPQGASVDQLRAIPADQLVGAGATLTVVDGRILTETPASAFAAGRQAPAPLIIGSNTWEASLLAPSGYAGLVAATPDPVKAAYADEAADQAKLAQDLFTDGVMGAPARWYAGRAAARSGAWLYEFAYVRVDKRGKIPGANHTSENPYVFDTQMIVPNYAAEIVDADRAVAAFMHSCWVAFAKTGKPGCSAEGRAWPRYSPDTDELMLFDAQPSIVAHYRKPQLDAQTAAKAPR